MTEPLHTGEGLPLCSLCGRARSDHMGFQHAFSEDGLLTDMKTAEKAAERNEQRNAAGDDSEAPRAEIKRLPGGDPVLRLALIRAGVITPSDLEAVEHELKATGISYAEHG